MPSQPKPDDDPNDPIYDPTLKKTSFKTYWYPTQGSMGEFMVCLNDTYLEYRSHHYWKRWHRHHQKRATFKLVIEPALLRQYGISVPHWQADWYTAHSDFAAGIKIKRGAEATGEFAEVTQCFTSVITGDAAVTKTNSLSKGSLMRQRLEASNITEFISATTVVVMAMGEAKNNLAYYATVVPQAWHVLMTGEAPVGTKLEFYHRGVRLKNSHRPGDGKIHDPGLLEFDAATMQPEPILKGGYDKAALGDLVARMSKLSTEAANGVARDEGSAREAASKLMEFRDGCGDQFQCLHSFLYCKDLDTSPDRSNPPSLTVWPLCLATPPDP